MKCLHIITPVKDSIDSTLETVKAIMESDILVPFTYTVYNDFSTEENTHRLEEAARQWNFRLVNLSDLTDHPTGVTNSTKRSHRSRCRIADCGIGCYCQKKHIAITIQWSIATETMRNCSSCDNRWKRHNQLPLPTRQGTRESSVPGKKALQLLLFTTHPRTAESIWLSDIRPKQELVWCDHLARVTETRFPKLPVHHVARMAQAP